MKLVKRFLAGVLGMVGEVIGIETCCVYKRVESV